MKKKFRDTEAWKYIRTFFQMCLIALAILAFVLLWNALTATAGAEDLTTGYVVYDEPEYIGGSATIVSNGRLAARKNVNGKRTRWLKNGASLKVYYASDEWCVTNCGYVQTQYLELEGE